MYLLSPEARAVFHRRFHKLCLYSPYPWQEQVFTDLLSGQSHWPKSITAPTGAGKTNLMAIWLLALIHQIENDLPVTIPRRLAWVVNRRVVVDQATTLAERFAKVCADDEELRLPLLKLSGLDGNNRAPLAVSTLRGEKADNRQWRKDPARPAIIVGTVDMIGSRLLFRGYGDGIASRPQHAALLGHDALIVNDEAHLTPAFHTLLRRIEKLQGNHSIKPFHTIQLTATPDSSHRYPANFDPDLAHSETFRRRFESNKSLHLHQVDDKPTIAKKMLDLALEEGSLRTIVFFQKPKEVQDFARNLHSKLPDAKILTITGTQRGYERDCLADSPGMQNFFCAEPPPTRHFLIATSAGEVGIDVTSDRLITSLDTADHLLQRFGRLNRFGESAATEAHVVFTAPKEKEPELQATLDFLKNLPNLSPKTLFHRTDRPAPSLPKIAPLEDWIVDRWSLTSLTDGMLKVADYLHGLDENNIPRTVIAWREEVDLLTRSTVTQEDLEKSLRVHRILAHEKVDVPLRDAIEYLQKLNELQTLPASDQARISSGDIWLIVDPPSGPARPRRLKDVLKQRELDLEDELAYATLILPPRCCFLENGMLTLNSEALPPQRDVADLAPDDDAKRARIHIHFDGEEWTCRSLGDGDNIEVEVSENWAASLTSQDWKLIYETNVTDIRSPDSYEVIAYLKKPGTSDFQTGRKISLQSHIDQVVRHATRLSEALHLNAWAEDIISAAQRHDEGKYCDAFQRAVGGDGRDRSKALAKSGRRGKLNLAGFRHELRSLGESPPLSELAMHLVAAHHGCGRPHFEECALGAESSDVHRHQLDSQPNRFGVLQEQFGPWALAYLESVLRAADWLASEEEQAGHV